MYNIRWYVYITILCLFKHIPLVAIEEISSLSHQLPHPRTHHIYVFDIDNTLVQPDTVLNPDNKYGQAQYGSEQWGAAQVGNLIESGMNKKDAIKQVQQEYAHFLKNEMNPQVIEEGTKKTIDAIKRKAFVYAITSRRSEFSEATHRQFTTLGISMSGNHDAECRLKAVDGPSESDQHNPLYSRGIVFAGDYSKGKGDALLRLLTHKYGKIPHDKHIVFVDDKKSAVEKVEEACKRNNIPCTALRYTACDEHIKQLIPSGKLP